MDRRVVKPPGQDMVVERLKSRYGLAGSCPVEQYDMSGVWAALMNQQRELSNFDQTKYKRRIPTSPESSLCLEVPPIPPACPSQQGFNGYSTTLRTECRDRRHKGNTPSQDSDQDNLDTYCSGDKVVSTSRCYSDERKHPTTPFCSSFKHLNVNCLDDELDSFHNLKKWETEKELIEDDHRDGASKITKPSFREIEKDALPTNTTSSRLQTERCSDFVDSPLKHGISPKPKVSKKQSLLPHQISQIYDELFHIHLKLQLNEVSEENRKMEIQAKRVQARLDNLQRKYEFLTVQKLKGDSHAAPEMKNLKQEKVPVSKPFKTALNGQLYELLIVFMDWISDHHLNKVEPEEPSVNGEKPSLKPSQRSDIQEKCVKLLPLMTEQLQWMPFVNTKLHEPFIKFIYWSIRQLDAGTQHSTMTSTLRRLGEDIFKGVAIKGIQDNSSEHSVENKPKTAVFFRSSSLPLRFLSTLIVLKTVTQADYLAQAFDSLCLDLKTDEGKALFLEYQAVPVILRHLRISSKGLLSNVIDSLLQMTVESPSLQPFLEACSNSLFFRTCSVLLRTPKLDLHILEKLSIILQKLSKIKGNKKLFEVFTIHLMLQEIQRTTHPEHAFLCINLNSTLFNLGLTKCNSLVSSTSH
ncbi:coiled-coil domain-containing protein 138 isoform X3 [Peromyscus californicus insignis]|uniref:coiled-coil domain-containing protein 138 isoform X3 n=1 Tax=Peromyscus californicus insignis TaxID=564181 RepID=UPI0022A72184|nr:coiled-coil domain-containing protein 138 isoform X3 [Peromyscus californicus insignis]